MLPSWLSALVTAIAPAVSSVGHTLAVHWRLALVALLVLTNVAAGIECKHLLAQQHAAAARAAQAEHENVQLMKVRDSLATAATKAEVEHAAADSALHVAETKVTTRVVYVASTPPVSSPDTTTQYLPVNLADIPEVHDLIQSADDEKAKSDAQIIVLAHQLAVDDTIIHNDSLQLAAAPVAKESAASKVVHVLTGSAAGAAGAVLGGALAGPPGIIGGALVGALLGLVHP